VKETAVFKFACSELVIQISV